MFLFVWLIKTYIVTYVSCFGMGAMGIGRYVGPADLIYKEIVPCEDFTSDITFSISQKKYNRTTLVWDLYVKSPYIVDDNLTIELKGSVKKEGGYKPGAFYLKETLCKTLNLLLGEMTTQVLEAMGANECPFGEGEYSAQNFYFDNSKFVVPQLFGEYKMEMFIYKNKEITTCYIGYFDLIPK